MRRFSFVFTLISMALPLFGSGEVLARDRALIVGINHYPGLAANGNNVDLTGPVLDAGTFRQLLIDFWHFDPTDIELLSDEAATAPAILKEFENWLINGSKTGDRVVFYFAGHGATAVVHDPNGVDHPTSTIVTASSRFEIGNQISGMIEGRTIGELLNRIRDRRIMVVADSCHSGSVTRGGLNPNPGDPVARTISPRGPVNLAPEDWTSAIQIEMKTSARFIDIKPNASGKPDSFVVWSAATLDQSALEIPHGGGGLFTQSMARGLRGQAASRDGSVTSEQLLTYISAQSKDFCNNPPNRCAAPQPTLEAPPAYRNLILKPSDNSAPPQNTANQAAEDASNLLGHKNDFGLKAEISPGPTVRLGDHVKFRITSEEGGTLVVLDANADGKLRQIFPNAHSVKNNIAGAVRAGAPIAIPDPSYGMEFVATDPGKGTLLVLVAEKALDLSGLLSKNLNFEAANDPRGIVVELSTKVQEPLITPDLNQPNRGYRWAFVAVPYIISP